MSKSRIAIVVRRACDLLLQEAMRALVGVLMTIAACEVPQSTARLSPFAEAPAPAGIGDVDRGAYVAAVGGCVACHGADLSGGPNHETNLGAWRGPNITPDRATGIGDWTSSAILTAIRDGVRPDGTRIEPPMPYAGYHWMTDVDAHALVAYLMSRPPISHEVPPSHLSLPAEPLPPPARDIDVVTDPFAHGRYLASLMHCTFCHGENYAGGQTFEVAGTTVTAPNITSDKEHGIGRWSETAVIRAVRGMVSARGRVFHGPMMEYRPAWKQLTDDDARALAAFVRAIPPAPSPSDNADAAM
jgi:mono/diheme cytochrome c family protein